MASSVWTSLYPLLLFTTSPLGGCYSSFTSISSCGPGRSWAVRLNADTGGVSFDGLAQNVAEDVGLVNHGQIGQLEGHYLLCQGPDGTANVDSRITEAALDRNTHVVWHSQEHILRRSKRAVTFNDPKYPSQWHLVRVFFTWMLSEWLEHLFVVIVLISLYLFLQHNDLRHGMDINVTGIWERNITGVGVTVVVVDDGVQHTLVDIQPNYVSKSPVSVFHPFH